MKDKTQEVDGYNGIYYHNYSNHSDWVKAIRLQKEKETRGEKITLVRGTAYLQTTVYRPTTNLKEQDRVININSKDVFFVAYIDLKNKTPLAIIISVDETMHWDKIYLNDCSDWVIL